MRMARRNAVLIELGTESQEALEHRDGDRLSILQLKVAHLNHKETKTCSLKTCDGVARHLRSEDLEKVHICVECKGTFCSEFRHHSVAHIIENFPEGLLSLLESLKVHCGANACNIKVKLCSPRVPWLGKSVLGRGKFVHLGMSLKCPACLTELVLDHVWALTLSHLHNDIDIRPFIDIV